MTHEEQIKWMTDQITKLEGQYKAAMDTTAMLVGKLKPQRTWVGLTDEDEFDWKEGGNLKDLVKAIEAKLKEKNT
jgi:hypothetical protein